MSVLIKKPEKMRVVDMCIYIDNNVYKEAFDATTIYEYLYNIVYLLAVKHKLFTEWTDYEPFALYAASRLYLRLTDERQFLPDDDNRRLKKVASILNYIKTVMHPYVVDYQQEYYMQSWVPEDETTLTELNRSMTTKALSENRAILQVEVEHYIEQISATIKHFLTRSPYYSNKATMKNIYISCLLTLVKAMTLSKDNLARLTKRIKKGNCTDYLIETLFRLEAKDSVTLYHLPNSMYNYIATLTNQIKRLINQELSELIKSNQPSDEMIKYILASPVANNEASTDA